MIARKKVAIAVGDWVVDPVRGEVGELNDRSRVMAIAEGYAMCRYKGCHPFVVSLKKIERADGPEC